MVIKTYDALTNDTVPYTTVCFIFKRKCVNKTTDIQIVNFDIIYVP